MSEDLRPQLEEHLQSLNIRTSCVEHPPVFTVEEMMPHLQDVNGAVTKNLFLKDKKKKGLWLVSTRHDRQVNLNDLAKKLGVGSGNLRFANEAAMLEKLKHVVVGAEPRVNRQADDQLCDTAHQDQPGIQTHDHQNEEPATATDAFPLRDPGSTYERGGWGLLRKQVCVLTGMMSFPGRVTWETTAE
uniref:PrdX deacylase domain-containing protein 1 n=1 Tax=Monopterus albus TaxID=43700 RepID=A0A3Q3QEM1_MONAL